MVDRERLDCRVAALQLDAVFDHLREKRRCIDGSVYLRVGGRDGAIVTDL